MTTHHTKRFLTEDGALKHNMKGKNASLESAEVPNDWLVFRDASKNRFHAFADALTFYDYWREEALVGSKPQLHAWIGNKPRRAFIDVDMGVEELKTADCRAEDVIEAVEDAICYVLCMYYDFADEPVVRTTTCNRASKFSTHFRLKLVLASKHEHTHFLGLIQAELPEEMRKFIDTGATMALRLPNCYKIDKASGKEVKTVWTPADDFVPTFRDGLINFITSDMFVLPKIAPKKARTINKTKHYSEEDMEKIVSICNAREELKNHFYAGTSDKTGFLYYHRISAGFCMMCKREHESDGAYVSVSNRQWFINCWRKSKAGDSYIRMGNILSKKARTQLNVEQFVADIMADEVKDAQPDRAQEANDTVEGKEVIVAEDAKEPVERDWIYHDWTKFFKGEIDASEAPAYFKGAIRVVTAGSTPLVYTRNYDTKGLLRYTESHTKLFMCENDFKVSSVKSCNTVKFSELWAIALKTDPYKNMTTVPWLKVDPTPASTFNAFTGFKFPFVEQKVSIDNPVISKVIWHLRHIICSNDEGLFQYVLRWIADMFQNCHKKSGVAILLKSIKDGAGKNTLTDLLQAILGKQHSTQTDTMDDLVSNFNGDLKGKILCVCDEVQNYQHGKHATRFKSLITKGTLKVNVKGVKKGEDADDFMRFVFTSNCDVALRLNANDRRYLPIEVSPAMIGNRKYFKELHKEFADVDVQRAFFNLVCNIDLTDWEIRDMPVTQLKRDLIEINLGSTQRYVIEWASGERPEFQYDDAGEMQCDVSAVFDDYTRWIENSREHKVSPKRVFYRELRDNSVEKKNRRVEGMQTKMWVFTKQGMQEHIRAMLLNPKFTL